MAHFVAIAGEMDMGINGGVFFDLRMAANMRHARLLLRVKYIRQMVTIVRDLIKAVRLTYFVVRLVIYL